MAGHGADTMHHTKFVVYQASKWHKGAATLMGSVMWFWMMYRAKEDLPYLMTKHKPWHERNHGH
ncbi:hypothetical protein GGF31_008126 [Allomyces arbusculus]|nr:hypothetical protein GGF31_008126 [Allomyces arbusculus]